MRSLPEHRRIDVWVHAVSLGEVNAVSPLLETLIDQGLSILVTTMTPTGSGRVEHLYTGKVVHQYLPFDLNYLQKKFFKTWQPKAAVIVETELWPNMIRQARKAGTELILVNARLSPQSFVGYYRLRFFFKPLLNQFKAVLCQSEADSERFIRLGLAKDKVKTLGNLKFDMKFNSHVPEAFYALKEAFGQTRPVLIFASTHNHEEQQLLEQLPVLKKKIKDLVLLIAPRHPERFQVVYELAKENGFNVGLRSRKETLSTDNEVVVLDSLGELMNWFQLSDYAIVGGSFVDVGGHNVLEPIAAGLPVITGPIYYNFKSICSDLSEQDALIIASDMPNALERLSHLHQNPEAREALLINAERMMTQNQGVVGKYRAEVMACLE